MTAGDRGLVEGPRHGGRRTRKQLGSAAWQRIRRLVLQRDLWRCMYCGAEARVADHVVPPERYAGSHNDPANLVAACSSCNNSKRGMSIEEWYRKAGKPLPSWWLGTSAGDGVSAGYRFAYHHHRFKSGNAGEMLVGRMTPGAEALPDCPPDCTVPGRLDERGAASR